MINNKLSQNNVKILKYIIAFSDDWGTKENNNDKG